MKYTLQRETATILFELAVGECMAILTAGKRTENIMRFGEQYRDILELYAPRDERTAQEIIDDTFRKHGITVKQNEYI